MEKESVTLGRFSHMTVTAGLCVAILIVVIGFQLFHKDTPQSVSVTSSSTPEVADAEETPSYLSSLLGTASSTYDLSQIGPAMMSQIVGQYTALKDQGTYTPAIGADLASQLAPALKADVAFKTYTSADIHVDSNVSLDRTLQYRKDLGDALKPLMKNSDAEFELFAQYIDTKDPKYLDSLRTSAKNYQDAIALGEKITVPSDAASYHIAILNALGEFSSTLNALSNNADDPFASAALLRTYNNAEQDVYLSFNALAGYYKKKAS